MNNDDMTEKLSALLDDELELKESLSLWRLTTHDPEARQKLHRLAVASECLRNTRATLPGADFADRVSDAIAREPVVLAPRALRQGHRERLATLAMAASIAVLAVFVGRSLTEYSPMKANELLATNELGSTTAAASMEPELVDFLTMHNESAYMAGAQGLLPSIRLVSGSPGR